MGLLELEKNFAFYGAYHSNPVNVLIHVLFVWPIFWSALLLLSFTPTLCPFPLPVAFLPLQEYMLINYSFLMASAYALLYACLEPKAGSLAALLCLACWISANALTLNLGFALAWKVVLVTQVFCWASQIIGHLVFEGRSPAFLDNIVQAFVMAPFFVLLEVLQIVFGYEPYPGFHENVKIKVEENISQWKAKKEKKRL